MKPLFNPMKAYGIALLLLCLPEGSLLEDVKCTVNLYSLPSDNLPGVFDNKRIAPILI